MTFVTVIVKDFTASLEINEENACFQQDGVPAHTASSILNM